MPIYEYRCKRCGELIEVMLKITDSQPKRCKRCGGKLEKQISNTTFILKGSGWYATDYGKKDVGGRKTAGNQGQSGGNGAGDEDPSTAKESGAGETEAGVKESKNKSTVSTAK